ncbi:hypothetical protein RHGRI_032488 [Rhododendron griersonianum]|uniref:TIR domain-containing protein n=1 Tax=Rhododendron griersonianum TaxID=479676 RepID=A0AAV6IFU8_9ERIC|nr:hypothetical protein RHGRI_032488 [Rhododendron griersonianum]
MASSSNSEFQGTYDIFLSFRGLDTRKKFTDHLYEALKREKFQTFRDDDEIERGETIKSKLKKAIENSRMSIIVLSKNYANSMACLFEIQSILEQSKTSNHMILPVFYEVDPMDIKEQAKNLNFGKKKVTTVEEVRGWKVGLKEVASMARMGLDFGKKKVTVEEVRGWRAALKEVASMAGMVSRNRTNGYEAKFIEEIVVGSNQLLIPPTKDFVESTQARNIEKVWECLMNDDVRQIGVYGMGGVGKTTIMKHIHNQLLEKKGKFGNVYWVTVSKAFSITKLQSDIAKALNLSFRDDEDETIRASELYAALFQKKKYVLILDDLWESFALERVGIPEPTRSNECKIVLTTRLLEVCRRMHCTKVKVELLTEQEARTLFLRKAIENDTVLAPEVEVIAAEIAKECARLPLAIVAVAGSLRGLKGTSEWRNALNELMNSTTDASDDESEVFERLKFSYSHLGKKVLQDCFLYCSLYPEDRPIPVNELIEYWIAEELIVDMDNVEAQFDKGHAILGKLTSSCLLESITEIHGMMECVMLHDLIRDMAIRIIASSPRFMVKAGEKIKGVPYEHWSKDLDRISFMDSLISGLPITPPDCPRLTTLLLNSRYGMLRVISDSFFINMPCLAVLDLSRSRITSLPESISNLENLHALILDNCSQLKYVPSLKKLKALTKFVLTFSEIKELPECIEELVNLRKLDLSRNFSVLKTVRRWKLRRLSKLQYLRIDGTRIEVSAEDLLCLSQLKVVAVNFHNVQELTKYAISQQFQGLQKYRLIVEKYDFFEELD